MTKYLLLTPGPVLPLKAKTLPAAKAEVEARYIGSIYKRRGYTRRWVGRSNGAATVQAVNTKGRVVAGLTIVRADSFGQKKEG